MVVTASSRTVQEARLLIIVFFVIWKGIIFIIVPLFFDRGYLQGVDGDDLEIGAAFVAGDYFACINVIDINIQRVVAFGAND